MAERITKISITAQVNSYLSGMDQVVKKTREGRTEAEALTARLEAQQKAFKLAGRTLLVGGGLVAAGLALAVKKAADFDQAMSNVNAVMNESAAVQKQLRDAAIEAGGATVFTARESANAIEELAKAGIQARDVLGGGLKGALDLAASGQLEVARAAEITGITLKQFNLEGSEAGRVADVLSAGANKAVGSVEDLAQGLKFVGPVSKGMNVSLEDTVATLALFADQGIIGEQAGTSLRGMLSSLTSPSKQAAAEIERLGIRLYDANGRFLGMENAADQLNTALAGVSDAQRDASLGILFGNQQITAARVLVSSGAETWRDYRDAVDDAGIASRIAADRLDNLAGDWEKLTGAIDSALISLGESGQGPLRAIVQGLTDLVDGFNDLPEPAKQVVFWVGAVTAAVLLAGGTALVAIPKIAALKVAMAELGITSATVRAGMSGMGRVMSGPLAMGITAATLAVVALQKAVEAASASSSEMQNTLVTAKSAADIFATALKGAEARLDFGGGAEKLKDLKGTLDALIDIDQNWWKKLPIPGGVGDTYGPAANALKRVGEELAALAASDAPAAARAFQLLAAETDGTERQLWALLANMPAYQDALREQATAAGLADDKQNLLNLAMRNSESPMQKAEEQARSAADAYMAQAQEIDGVRQAMIDLVNQMNAANSAQQQAVTSNAQFVTGLAEIAGAADQNGTSLDQSTAAGARNAAMLAGLAGDAQAAAAAQYEVDQSTMSADDAAKKYNDTLAAQRKKFEDAAIAAGFSKDEVKKLADQVFALPSEKDVKVHAETAAAEAALARIKAALNYIDTTPATVVVSQAGGNSIARRATGGILPGPPSNRDNMIAAVASGEFIVRASQTAIPENRRVLEYINAGGRMRGYADGGFVQPTYAAPTRSQQVVLTTPSVGTGRGDVNITINNSPTRDLERDAWEAVQLAGSLI